MSTQEREHTLFSRAQGADARAFEELAERCRPRLLGIIRCRLGEHLEIECDDVLQEVLMRAYESLKRIEWQGEDALIAWFGTIAENVILNHARRQKRERKVPVDSALAGTGTSASTAMQRERRFARLQAALDSLSPEARRVVLMARIDGLKLKDIAERVGRSPEAVRMLLRRSVQKLKDRFGETGSLHLPHDRRLEAKEDRNDDA